MPLLEDLIARISFDDVAMALISCIVIREVMIAALPDRIAGPGGWLIDTGARQDV